MTTALIIPAASSATSCSCWPARLRLPQLPRLRHQGTTRRRPCRRCGGTGIRFRPGAPLLYRAISGYRRHRANGNLTPPPLRRPRRRPDRATHPEGETTRDRPHRHRAVIYLAFHAGHAHANYRHGRARGHRGINLYWSSVRGPWISIPGPFGTRIGHRL